MRVVIVGAGLSGLTLAAMLRRINIPSVIFESAPNFEAVFQPPMVLWANSLSCMRAFGLDDVFATTQAVDPSVSSDPFAFLKPVMKDTDKTEEGGLENHWSTFEHAVDEIPPEDYFGIRDARTGKWLLKQHNQLIQLPPMEELDNIPSSNAPFATANSVVSRTIIQAHKTRLANVPLRVTLPAQTVKRTLMSHCSEIRFGRTVVAIEPSKGKFGGAIVHLDNGETDWGDIVIGADGLHSTVRKLIYTAEDQSLDLKSHNMLQIDGYTRVSEFSPNLGVNPCEFWGKRKVFSYYPNMVANNTSAKDDNISNNNKHIVSFSATVFDAPKEISDLGANLVEMQPALRELMTREFCKDGDFGCGNNKNSDDIVKIFKEAAILRPYELLKVPIMPHWHHKRACLIGDAAHGGFPSYLMQDASLCVEDAAILTTIIANLPLYNDRGWEYGFRKFEKARRYRIERHSRQSQAVRDFCANTNPGVRNLMLQATPPMVANHFLKWLNNWSYKGSEAEFDPESDEKEKMNF